MQKQLSFLVLSRILFRLKNFFQKLPKLQKWVLLVICFTHHVLQASPTEELEERTLSKFKLGFEFQECSHLCPWNVERNDIQKKAIFSVVMHNSTELWKIVIDAFDIEFVTVPFRSDHSPDDRNLCMQSIKKSLDSLKNLLEKENNCIIKNLEDSKLLNTKYNLEIDEVKKLISNLEQEQSKLGIEIRSCDNQIELSSNLKKYIQFLNLIKPNINELGKADLEEEIKNKEKQVENYESDDGIKKSYNLSNKNIKIQLIENKEKLEKLLTLNQDEQKKQREFSLQKGQITFKNWIVILKSEFNIHGLELKEELSFTLVENKYITLPRLYQTDHNDNWNPQFSPQVTVQHPLSITIPLYFYLFSDTSHISKFAAALPQLSFLKTNHQDDSLKKTLCTPLNNLIFLHALTLISISDSNSLMTDSDALESTLRDYEKYKQINTKMNLLLMSRWSFSEMFSKISMNLNQSFNFYQYYQKEFIDKNEYFRALQIKDRIKDCNYGKQLFDQENEPKNLLFILSYFKNDFYQNNKQVIRRLLKNGIITTIMLRNFKEDYTVKHDGSEKTFASLLNHYFDDSIKSVQKPKNLRYDFETNSASPNFDKNQANVISIKGEDTLLLTIKEDQHDSLSPPWFLGLNDSMGQYSRTQSINISERTDDYGEALIEIRAPEELLHKEVHFKYPDDIENHVNTLFNSITEFQHQYTNVNLQKRLLSSIFEAISNSHVR